MGVPKFEKLKSWYLAYERHISSGALLFGFVVDNLTLTRIDLLFDNLVLFFYIMVVGVSIASLHISQKPRYLGTKVQSIGHIAPPVMQFAFGGLFSGFAVFYMRSASLAASWPFLLLMFSLLVGNEFLRDKYARFTFQVSMFFFVLFSYMIFFIPTMIGAMGAWVFLLSGAVSVSLIAFFLYILSKITPQKIQESRKHIIAAIGGVYLILNGLYFTNIIPPIPLSLKEAHVFHKVERLPDGGYQVQTEDKNVFDYLKSYDEIHIQPEGLVYAYTAVFAPTKLDAHIYHVWEYYDEAKKKWIETDRIGFSVFGGRDGGYRGYTVKARVTPGLWRVDVVTDRGQLLGRLKFKAYEAGAGTKLREQIL